MLFVSTNDFFEKVSGMQRLERAQELQYAEKLQNGDEAAREKLVEGYIPFVAAHIKHLPEEMQTLEMIYRCIQALEKAVDSFDFLQEHESFAHRLSWYLRQTTVKYTAERRNTI